MDQHTTSAHSLVSSKDVNGTKVFSRAGTEVGNIDHLMIDKKSGKVAYAVMGFGGFLGMGEDHHPLPWGALNYDTSLGGFVTDVTREQLEGAPDRPRDWQSNREWEQRTFDYYRAPYYWL